MGWVLLGALSGPALADDADEDGTISEGHKVELTDNPATTQKDKRGYKNLLVLGVGFFPRTIKGRYQRLLTDRLSLMIGGGYGQYESKDAWWSIYDEVERSRRIVQGGFDFHPKGNGMHGFYIGPRVKHTWWRVSYDATWLDWVDTSTMGDEVEVDVRVEEEITTLTVAGIAGWRWVWNPGASLALGLGAQQRNRTGYHISDIEAESADITATQSGLGFAFEFQLGWAF